MVYQSSPHGHAFYGGVHERSVIPSESRDPPWCTT